MNIFSLDSKLYKLTVWMMRLAYVNVLWLSFSLLGLVIFGFFPSTISMFTIVRHWIKGKEDIPIWSTFWQSYKQSFLKVNLWAPIIIGIGYILYRNLIFFVEMNNQVGGLLFYLSIALAIFYLLFVAFLIPVYVHFDIKGLEIFKYSFIISVSYPIQSFYIVLTSVVIIYLSSVFPAVAPFFSGSILSLLVMRFAYVVFMKIESKNRKQSKQEISLNNR
ncbi:hypothetical protein BTS2_0296 [Bacillus sp. TS-2]|nr:hypothetical protein BTS2_0296 [Bacillus sp. TS-2]